MKSVEYKTLKAGKPPETVVLSGSVISRRFDVTSRLYNTTREDSLSDKSWTAGQYHTTKPGRSSRRQLLCTYEYDRIPVTRDSERDVTRSHVTSHLVLHETLTTKLREFGQSFSKKQENR